VESIATSLPSAVPVPELSCAMIVQPFGPAAGVYVSTPLPCVPPMILPLATSPAPPKK
jgi:hypothetical protein